MENIKPYLLPFLIALAFAAPAYVERTKPSECLDTDIQNYLVTY